MEEKLPLTETSQKPTAGVTPKKKKGKKRRISKHIADAAKNKSATNPQQVVVDEPKNADTATNTPAVAVVAKKHKRRKTSAVKDPAEAATYLMAWQKQHEQNGGSESASGGWKFNKNTQSWLIRHMYEADKVSKANFEVLLDYLKAGDQNTIQRCREDATRRALRYQKLTTSSAAPPTNPEDSVKNSSDAAVTKPQDDGDAANASRQVEDEEERWNKLDEHEKRKEYKRARKVLDQLS